MNYSRILVSIAGILTAVAIALMLVGIWTDFRYVLTGALAGIVALVVLVVRESIR